MRLGFAIAAHLDADILLLDEVFAVGDEAFQRKCFGKVFEFKQRGGTIVFVSHDATQVERLCERAVLLREGRLEFDGPTHEAIVRYRRMLAAEADPAERAAGLREWGTGEATIAAARLVGREGQERQQFLAGEPFSLRLRIEAGNGIAPPQLQLEVRDEAGLLVASDVLDTARVGWSDGTRELRYDVDPLPPRTAASTSGSGSPTRAAIASSTGSTTRSASSSTRRVRSAASSGWKELGRGAELDRAMSSRSCPDWPDLMELAPDLQFMHYTVAEAQLPVEVLTAISHVSLGDVAICCDLEHHVFYAGHTDSQVAGRSAGRTGTRCASTPSAAPASQRLAAPRAGACSGRRRAGRRRGARSRQRGHVAEAAHRVCVGRADDRDTRRHASRRGRRRGRAGRGGRSPRRRRPSRARPRRRGPGRARSRAVVQDSALRMREAGGALIGLAASPRARAL